MNVCVRERQREMSKKEKDRLFVLEMLIVFDWISKKAAVSQQ